MMRMMTRTKTWRRYALVALALLLAGAGMDLFGPRRSDLREFDPEAVARLETDMWRSYYDRREIRLFFQLAELLRTQFRAPLLRSNLIAYRGAKAAFVFKDGKERSDYERALPDLIDYYAAIRRISTTPFDVNQVAKLELEWWIIHREREKYGSEALALSLADLQAAVYELPAGKFAEHGRLRAEAMLLRDARWDTGAVSESDWSTIHELLRRSWRHLWTEVQIKEASRHDMDPNSRLSGPVLVHFISART